MALSPKLMHTFFLWVLLKQLVLSLLFFLVTPCLVIVAVQIWLKWNKRPKNNTSVSMLVSEETISHLGGQENILSFNVYLSSLVRSHSTWVDLFDNQRTLFDWILNWIHSTNCLIQVVVMHWNICSFIHLKIKQTLHYLFWSFKFHLPLFILNKKEQLL